MNIPTPGIYGQRVLLWIGIVCAALYGFSYVVLLEFLPPPAPLLDTASVVALYAHSNIQFRIGAGLMILVGAFAVPISIPVAIQIARMEKGFPYLATIQILTSLVGAWIFAWPAVLWSVCAFTVNRSPEITVALHQLAWFSFITPGSFFWMQLGTVGLAPLVGGQDVPHPALPRWFGWFSIFAAVETSVLPTFAGVFWTGPFAWNGWITFYLTIVVYAAWLAMLLALVFKSLRRQELDRSQQ